MSDKLTIVAVHWLDTCYVGGWTELPELLECDSCHAVGFLVCEDEYKIVLAQISNENGDKAGLCIIPRGCVVEQQVLSLNPA